MARRQEEKEGDAGDRDDGPQAGISEREGTEIDDIVDLELMDRVDDLFAMLRRCARYRFRCARRHVQSSSSSLTEGAAGPLPPITSSACLLFESRITLTTPAAIPNGMRASMTHGAVPKYLSTIQPRPMHTARPTKSSVTARIASNKYRTGIGP